MTWGMMLARLAFIIRAYKARVGPLETMSMTPIRSLFMNRAALPPGASRWVPSPGGYVPLRRRRFNRTLPLTTTDCQSDFLSWPQYTPGNIRRLVSARHSTAATVRFSPRLALPRTSVHLTVGQAILPAAAFPGGFSGHVPVTAPSQGRLKAGCSHDWLPHKTVRDFGRTALDRFQLFFQHLLLTEIRVVSAGFHQFFVCAALDDPAALQHHDGVGLPDGGDAV